MARQCSICHHPDKGVIDRALIGGTPQMEIAREHGVSQAALSRHLHRHLGPTVAHALGKYEPADREQIAAYVLGMLNESFVGYVRAKRSGDDAEMRAWLGEARKQVELRARLAGFIGAERIKLDVADMQEQAKALAGLSEDELRRLAAGAPALEPGAATPPLYDPENPVLVRDAEPHAVTQTAEHGDEA